MIRSEEIAELERSYCRANAADPANIRLLQHLSLQDREEFARQTKTCVLYLGDEVALVQQAEEHAALSAAPKGYALEKLNGLNIGCGDRRISPHLIPVDIMKAPPNISGAHHAFLPGAILSLADQLPFRNGTIDFIVSLHMLEHMPDPVAVVRHWLDLLKPGGGIGIVVPDWRYSWDSRNDRSVFGHKWNCSPEFVRGLWKEHWSSLCELEGLATYPYKLSFDFVLRKPGEFAPFTIPDPSTIPSGASLYKAGVFLG